MLQIATQVRFALDYARLLERVDTKADQAQVFIDITRRIRKSLNEENVLKTTVEEIRKELSADRVIVYGFDANWYGTVIAESVVPGFPKALRARINDPCFAQGYVELYQTGRVKVIEQTNGSTAQRQSPVNRETLVSALTLPHKIE